jgi:alkylation response protein AidB-like acyl-CoA dehydrogenase
MPYQVTDEQQLLASTLSELLSTHGTPRNAYDGGPARDPDLWARLCELGIVGIGLPERLGGAGGSLMDDTIVAEQIGRATAVVPILTNVLASSILAALSAVATSGIRAIADTTESSTGVVTVGTTGPASVAETAGALVGGRTVVLAAVSAARAFDLGFTACETSDGWRLDGTVDDLLDGASADVLVVPASIEDGLAWFAVDVHAEGATLTEQPSLDPTQRLAAIDLASAGARHLGSVDLNSVEPLLSRAWVILGAQAVGAAERALEITVEYAKQRQAFGQPIGRFQAIKHRVSEMLIDVQNARSAVYNAAWAIDAKRTDAALAARMAKAVATENAVHAVHEAIQCHGGIGFTWEHDLHLYLRRVKSAQLVLGDTEEHFAELGRRLIEPRRLVGAATSKGR